MKPQRYTWNLSEVHIAHVSQSLLFTINDLLVYSLCYPVGSVIHHPSIQDLTRLESGNTTSFNEPFDLHDAIQEATHLYKKEAERRNISFILKLEDSPRIVVGDEKKIRTVVQNLTGNSCMSVCPLCTFNSPT
jgi:signal transduction histidine kinase